MRRAVSILAALLTAFPAIASGRVGGDVIDRVVAVVEGRLITLSDVRAVNALRLLEDDTPSAPVPEGADPVVERYIDRVLVLREVERYSPAPPDAASVDAGLAAVAHRAGSPDALAEVLKSFGASSAWLRQWITDDLRIKAYVDQRFANAVQASDEDLESVFREHPSEFAGKDVNDPAVQEEARSRVMAIRRRALLADWVAGLRRRAEITRPAR
jgi:hypothetical protein